MKRSHGFLVAAALAMAGCSFGPPPAPAIAVYDFGIESPRPTAARVRSTLALDDVAANAQLHTSAILFRLAYRNAAQLQPYSRSRWAAEPAALVSQRLRLALAQAAETGFTLVADGVRSEHVLRVELETFEQLVDAPDAGRGIVRMRASLISNPERNLRAQRVFVIERASSSVDAEGAVGALSGATDELIAQMIDWVARETASSR